MARDSASTNIREGPCQGFSGDADGKTEAPCQKLGSPKAGTEMEFGVQDVY